MAESSDVDELPTPTLLSFFKDMIITDVAACNDFSAVVTCDNYLYLFGKIHTLQPINGNEDISVEFEENIAVPRYNEVFGSTPPIKYDYFVKNDKKITQIVAKEEHLSILTSSNEIFVLQQYHTQTCTEITPVPDVQKVLQNCTIQSFDGGPSIITSDRRGYGFSAQGLFEAEFVTNQPIAKSITGKLSDHFALVVMFDNTLHVIGENE